MQAYGHVYVVGELFGQSAHRLERGGVDTRQNHAPYSGLYGPQHRSPWSAVGGELVGHINMRVGIGEHLICRGLKAIRQD
jgi:hypothetical protein